ncbi:MAG: hypothetical protein AABY22_36275 [Nanoarchaeota archaeon]
MALKNQFEFYNIAIKNKEAALKLQKENADKAAADLAAETAAKETAAKLAAISVTHTTPAVVTAEIKGLKKSWDVEVSDDKESAIKIIAAFVGNIQLCEEKLRVKSWLNLSVQQMASALAAVKKNDEAFECGVKFKLVEKL